MDYYDKLTDLNVLYDAYRKCVKGVDWKCNIQKYEANILPNLLRLRNRLINGTYIPKPFTEFDICERGKTRHIKSPAFEDRILQRAICDQILEPVLYPYLIYDNGASVKGKGVKFSRQRLKKHLCSYYEEYGNKGYILMCDFKSFFDTIPHDKIIQSISNRIPDERFMDLFNMIIKSFGDDNGRGLGIGAQISQICGIYYPTPLDNYIRNVRGCKLHGRHMDDFYIIHHDKDFLKQLLNEIVDVTDELGLTLNQKKTQIYRIDKGFVFLKQRISVTNTGKVIQRPVKDIFVRERRKLKKLYHKVESGEITEKDFINQYKSWRGEFSKYNCHRTLLNMDNLFYELQQGGQNGQKKY